MTIATANEYFCIARGKCASRTPGVRRFCRQVSPKREIEREIRVAIVTATTRKGIVETGQYRTIKTDDLDCVTYEQALDHLKHQLGIV